MQDDHTLPTDDARLCGAALLDADEIEMLLTPAPARPSKKAPATRLRIELARTHVPSATIATWNAGSVVTWDAAPGDPVDVYLADTLTARGELYVDRGAWSVRIVELISAATTPREN